MKQKLPHQLAGIEGGSAAYLAYPQSKREFPLNLHVPTLAAPLRPMAAITTDLVKRWLGSLMPEPVTAGFPA